MSSNQEDQNENLSITQSPAPEIDHLRLEMHLRQLRDNQNLVLGALGGFGASIVGAVLWALISYVSSYQIGFMAVGVGFLVGLGVRTLGQGIDLQFRITGALLAVLGCVIGNVLMISVFVSKELELPLFQILTSLDFGVTVELLKETFSPIDILFYGLAVYAGYQYSVKPVDPAEFTKSGQST